MDLHISSGFVLLSSVHAACLGYLWCSLDLFQNFSCGQQALSKMIYHSFVYLESLSWTSRISCLLWATSECALFFVLSCYFWSRITNILYCCFLQMSANDCQDPPDYWTIHGLWYRCRLFWFQSGKKNFYTKMFRALFSVSFCFMIASKKSLSFIGNSKSVLM